MKKTLALAILLILSATLNAQAYDPVYSNSAAGINKITDVTTKTTNQAAEETYNPIAFAADFYESIDKNIYQNKEGAIIIGKKYVPDNY